MFNLFKRKEKVPFQARPIFMPAAIQREIVGQVQEGFVFEVRVDPETKRWQFNKRPELTTRVICHSTLISQDSPADITVTAQVCGQDPVAIHTERVQPGTYLLGLLLGHNNAEL